MTTITKESIADTIEGLEHLANSGIQSVYIDMAIAGMRRLLASLEAEAVYQVLTGDSWVDLSKGAMESQKRVGAIVRTVYSAPPAPVSVPDEKVKGDDFELNGPLSCYQAGKIDGWNECRAAMLQGAEHVSQRYTLPDGFDFDRFNDVVWLEAVASNPHMHSPTTSTIAMVALELNRKLAAGNSPVIPDQPLAWKVIFTMHGQPGSNFKKIFDDEVAMESAVSLHRSGGFNVQVIPLIAHQNQ